MATQCANRRFRSRLHRLRRRIASAARTANAPSTQATGWPFAQVSEYATAEFRRTTPSINQGDANTAITNAATLRAHAAHRGVDEDIAGHLAMLLLEPGGQPGIDFIRILHEPAP
jgi:hypothetical protein